jgi:multidrug efflux system outer membrane protein
LRKHSLGFLAAAALLVCGCTMIPKYQRPVAPVPQQYPGGPDHSADAADIRWRDFFADPVLKKLVELSLKNNRDLRVATLTVEQYAAEYRIQRANLYPTVDAGGSYTRSRSLEIFPEGGSLRTTSAIYNQYSVSVGTTSYEVDLFGRVRSLNQQALEQYFASDENRRSAQITLVAEVATQYLTLLEDKDQLELARKTLASVQESYRLNKKGFDLGTVSELDLSTAIAQVQTANVSIYNYQRLVAQAENYLALLVGAPLPADLPSGQSLPSQDTLADLPAGLSSDLIARRPDILSAEHTLLAANANIGAARAAFFPAITLTGSGGYTSLQLSQLFNNASFVWSFSPQISVPIFDAGSNQATLDAAVVSKRIEVANYEKAIQTGFREVSDALVARDRYTFQVAAQEALVAAEQRRYDLSNLRYRQGVDSYLTVLTAQQDLYNAQSGLITTRTDRLGNLITLYKALGGGWE